MVNLKRLCLGAAVTLMAFAGTAAAQQSMTIVSGNGQVVCNTCPSTNINFDPMVVMVKNADGTPAVGIKVNWTIGAGTDGNWTVLPNSVTDANGRAQTPVAHAQILNAYPPYFFQAAITASIPGATVIFHQTAYTASSGSVPNILGPQPLSPATGTTLTGTSGEQGDIPIQVQVVNLFGVGVPNVELRLKPADPTAESTLSCATPPGMASQLAPGTVLTDAKGIATCIPVFGGKAGTAQVIVAVGGNFAQFTAPINFEVKQGLPCLIRLISGNNQSGNPGALAPAPLVGEVDDCSGSPLSNVPVQWSVNPAAGATLKNSRTTSDANGRVSSNATLGGIPGAIQVQLAVAPGTPTHNDQPVQANFTLTVNLVLSGVAKISGDNQQATVNTKFTNPLIVQVNSQGTGIPGVPVQFAVASGDAVLVGSPNPSTNAQGQAQVGVQAGTNTGPVTVTATVGTLAATFNLSVIPSGPTELKFLNGAGFEMSQAALSPCSVATITGKNLLPGVQGTIVPTFFGPLPLLVANVSVQFGDSYAPIYSVSNIDGKEQVNVQVPCEVTPGAVPVTVRAGVTSATVTAQVGTISPGIFQTTMSDGKQRAVLLRPDGSFVSLENPARRGETIRMFVTGLGPVTPPLGTNTPGIPGITQTVNSSIIVGVNNSGVEVVGAQAAPNLIGVDEVDFVVPNDTPSGNDVPLAILLFEGNTPVFGNPSAIPVQ